jgi:hypothetical protein
MKPNLYNAYLSLLVFVAALWTTTAIAQSKVQVVTKTIERKLDYRKGDEVRITGEKAIINVKGWDKNYIGLTLKLIGKHPERAVAEKELEHLRYIIERNGNVQDIGNYFNVSKTTNPIRANLKAEFLVMVPENCPVTLSAKYGEANLSNTIGSSEIKLDYSKLTLRDVRGEMSITSTLSDISGIDTNLNLSCKADKADIGFSGASGTYRIENEYGHIRFTPGEQLKKLDIQSNRTDVTVAVRSFDHFNYNLSSANSELNIPAGGQQKRSVIGGKRVFEQVTDKGKPLIKVSTSSSPLTIRVQNL